MADEDEGSESRGNRGGGYNRRGGRGEGRGGGRGGGMPIKPNYFLPKPVKVGDEVDVRVEAVASKGDGIAKKDGFVIFIKGAKEGDTVRVKITDIKARFAIGEVIGPAQGPIPEPAPSAAAPQEGSGEPEEGAQA
jgi:predicted RNA-binding protein with TRAM domain